MNEHLSAASPLSTPPCSSPILAPAAGADEEVEGVDFAVVDQDPKVDFATEIEPVRAQTPVPTSPLSSPPGSPRPFSIPICTSARDSPAPIPATKPSTVQAQKRKSLDDLNDEHGREKKAKVNAEQEVAASKGTKRKVSPIGNVKRTKKSRVILSDDEDDEVEDVKKPIADEESEDEDPRPRKTSTSASKKRGTV